MTIRGRWCCRRTSRRGGWSGIPSSRTAWTFTWPRSACAGTTGRRRRGRWAAGSSTSSAMPDLEELNAWLLEWCLGVVDQQVHGTTHELPAHRFTRSETGSLITVDARPPTPQEWLESRIVPRDALVAVEANRYPVPLSWAGHNRAGPPAGRGDRPRTRRRGPGASRLGPAAAPLGDRQHQGGELPSKRKAGLLTRSEPYPNRPPPEEKDGLWTLTGLRKRQKRRFPQARRRGLSGENINRGEGNFRQSLTRHLHRYAKPLEGQLLSVAVRVC
jgi:hypothetical protein